MDMEQINTFIIPLGTYFSTITATSESIVQNQQIILILTAPH